MHAYVGLTYRFASLEHSSEIVKVDLCSEQIIARNWLPPPICNLTDGDRPNGGGRQRGARGVNFYGGYVHVATFDAIHVLDTDLFLIDTVTCERFSDVHEFIADAGGYVVTSTRMDAVVWIKYSGEVSRLWVATEDQALIDQFNDVDMMRRDRRRDWREIYSAMNPTHLNMVSQWNGRTFVALHYQGVLWDIEAGGIFMDARCLGADKTHNHSIRPDGTVWLNDTGSGRFMWFRRGEAVVVDVSAAGFSAERPRGLSAPWAVRHGWLRGLAPLSVDRVVVGQSPARLVELDIAKRRINKVVEIDSDWRTSVHGIAVDADESGL